jgi:hypothetical protein
MRLLTRIAFVIVLVALAFIPSLAAASKMVNVKIVGGGLGFDLISPAVLPEVDLTGFSQAAKGTLGTIEVRDTRGTGAGWNLVVKADDFISDGNPDKTIPALGFTIDPTLAVITVSGNTAPIAFSGPLDQPLKLLSAEADTGMGVFRINPDISLVVPAETFAGSYESTVSLTVTSGP